jgi:hypothetical protein
MIDGLHHLQPVVVHSNNVSSIDSNSAQYSELAATAAGRHRTMAVQQQYQR